jgi:NAD(P)-dependent dehydrogenase (short-subunit alcohol dehydrogenase family)
MAHGRFDNPIVAAATGILDIFRKQDYASELKDSMRIDGKVCVITGANSGLGYALAVDLARRGGHVIMACRSQIPEAGQNVKKDSGSENVEMRYLDLSKINSIHSFVEGLSNDGIQVDILILNAGVALPESRPTESGLEEMFLVNYLSNVIMTQLMLDQGVIVQNSPSGKDKPRIIFISSDSHQGSSAVDYNVFGKFEKYGVTKGMNYYSYYKLVLNTYAVELSRRLNKDDLRVNVHVICPGPVNTNIVREAPWLLRKMLKGIFYLFFKSPENAAKAVIYMAISDKYGKSTGAYMHMFNEKMMDEKCYFPEEGEKLFDQSIDVWKRVDDNYPSRSLEG